MGILKKTGREAQEAVDQAYDGDLHKHNGASSIVGSLFRKISTGEIDENDIDKAANTAASQLRTDYPEAWEGGVKKSFKDFFGIG